MSIENDRGQITPDSTKIIQDNLRRGDRAHEDPVVEAWANAPMKIVRYESGSTTLDSGEIDYAYPAGRRLIILGNHVMDTCETPWAINTIDTAFDLLSKDKERRGNGGPVRILEIGFGLGITADMAIRKLIGKGKGEYRVIELNKQVYQEAEKWRENWRAIFQEKEKEFPGTKPDIKITLYRGEGGEVAKDLADRAKKFDIIISDTYPLTPDEAGINDLKNLPILLRLLVKDGVFAFFPYVPGAETGQEGKTISRQLSLVDHYFHENVFRQAEITPPPDYTYLQGLFGPIRKLPVVVCRNPKQL